MEVWLASSRTCPGHGDPAWFWLANSSSTALSPLILLPVCLDGELNAAAVHTGPVVAVCLASKRPFPGPYGDHVHRPHLLPKHWAVSKGFPRFLSVWMSLSCCCAPRAKYSLMAVQHQTVLCHAEPTWFWLANSPSTGLSPQVNLPVCLDGRLCPAAVHLGPDMAV